MPWTSSTFKRNEGKTLLAAPCYKLKDAGAQVALVSPLGGQPPRDPMSDEADSQTTSTKRFKADPQAQAALANTGKLADASIIDFDAVLLPDHVRRPRGRDVEPRDTRPKRTAIDP